MGRQWWFRGAALAVACAVAAAVVVSVASAKGDPVAALRLGPGTAWFGSSSTGTVALIDGLSGDRLREVKGVARSGDRLEVSQLGSSALVLNRSQGTVLRIDAASSTKGPERPLGAPDERDLTVVAGNDVVWALRKEGTVAAQLEADRLDEVGTGVGLGERSAQMIVTPKGELWVNGPKGVRSLSNGQLRTRMPPSGVSRRVVLAGERPVLVDLAASDARVLDARSGRPGRRTCMDGVSADSLLAGSSGKGRWVVAVAADLGRLVVGDLGSGRCRQLDVGPAGPGRYGPPVENEGLIYLPDHVDRSVVVFEAAQAKEIGRISLGLEAGGRFTLFAHERLVWWDEVDGDRAGVLTAGLRALAVSKTRGTGRASTVPQTGVPEPGPTRLTCRATANRVEVDRPVTFEATLDNRPAVASEWSFAGGNPGVASGPTVATRWSDPGVKRATVTAPLPDRTPTSATCTVAVGLTVPTPPRVAPPGPLTPTSVARGPGPLSPGTSNAGPRPTTSTGSTTAPTTGPPPTRSTPLPLARFTVSSPAVAGSSVAFRDASSGSPTTWRWTFPSAVPSTSSEPNPSTRWAVPGSYVVRLDVANAQGQAGRSYEASVLVEPAPPPTVTDTFDDGAQGWTTVNGAPWEHKPTGGKPSGYVSATDIPNNQTWYWVAPSKYRGDQSAHVGRLLTFDLKQSATSDPILNWKAYVWLKSTDGTELMYHAATDPTTSWTHYDIPLDGPKWVNVTRGGAATTEDMAKVLGTVVFLRIRGEFQGSPVPDIGGLDNVVLGARPG